jgi:putative flippase GtrA
MIMTNPRERARFLRFAVVGVIGAVVDFGTMNLMVVLFAAPLVLAGATSFLAAILSNFTWNRYWTYPDSRTKPIFRQLGEFTLVSVIGLGIRVPTLAVLEPFMHRLFQSLPFRLPILKPEFLANNATLAVAVIIVMFWNFFVNRYWTYGDVE